jgi:hypothetical protein
MKYIGIKSLIKDLEDLKRRWKAIAVQTGRSQRRGSAMTSGVPAKPARARKRTTLLVRAGATTTEARKKMPISFVLDKDADATGTHRVATLRTSYKALVKRIGPPDHSDHDHSEVFQWAFRDANTGAGASSFSSVFIYLEPEAHMRGHETGKEAFDKVRKAASMEWGILARDEAIGKRFLAWFKRERHAPLFK